MYLKWTPMSVARIVLIMRLRIDVSSNACFQ